MSKPVSKMTDAEFIAEHSIRHLSQTFLMRGWNETEAAAKEQFKNATPEELFQIASGAMNHALGLK
jgi:hypothetical protein